MTIQELQEKGLAPQWLLAAITKDADVTVGSNDSIIWHSGIWEDGTWKNGTWEDGTWMCGTWEYGSWRDGFWRDGTWQNGVWHGGIWNNGIWKRGSWYGGIWNDGEFQYGHWSGGQWIQGELLGLRGQVFQFFNPYRQYNVLLIVDDRGGVRLLSGCRKFRCWEDIENHWSFSPETLKLLAIFKTYQPDLP